MISNSQTILVITAIFLMAKSFALPLHANPSAAEIDARNFGELKYGDKFFYSNLGSKIIAGIMNGYIANTDIFANTVLNTATDYAEMLADFIRNVGTIMSNDLLKTSRIIAANIEAGNTIGTNYASAIFDSVNAGLIAEGGVNTVQDVSDDFTNEEDSTVQNASGDMTNDEGKQITDSTTDQVTRTGQVMDPNIQ